MNLSSMKPSFGSTKNRKRVGRGTGSGHGKQSTQGAKGQKGSSGYKSKSWHEGGQMPLQRRMPKRGFHNIFRIDFQEINIEVLAKLDVPTIDLDVLRANRLLKRTNKPVKILGDGELTKPITVKAHAFSASAKDKIEKAGGKIEIITRPVAANSEVK